MLLDYVIVVEEPLTCRSDVGLAKGGGRQTFMDLVEQDAGRIEADKQECATPCFCSGLAFCDALSARESSGAFGEMLGAEKVASYRAGNEVIGWQ